MILGSTKNPGVASLNLPDGQNGRIAGIRFVPHLEHDRDETSSSTINDEESSAFDRAQVTLVVARDTADVDRTLASGVVADRKHRIGRALHHQRPRVACHSKPATAVSTRCSNRSPRCKHTYRSCPADHAPTELRPVIGHLNELIERLETAFQREKTFSADAAHELRTPLAGIRSTLEVSLSRRRENEEYQTTISNVWPFADKPKTSSNHC
ncbi:MAG: histidine kinase dimerization/phospho-acceptor domain-containing protein [Planctomycetaceae bacterium]